MKNIIKNFWPSWFVVNMGTGIVINLFSALKFSSISYILTILNISLFFSIFVIWIIRWFVFFQDVKNEFKNLSLSNFFVTMPISLMILGLNVQANSNYFGSKFTVYFSLISFVLGICLMLIFSVAITANQFISENVSHEMSNFSWFMAPVGNLIVSVLGYEIGNKIENNYLRDYIISTSSLFFGIGLFLFFVYLPILKNYYIMNSKIYNKAFPTTFILLAPIGAIIVAFISLLNNIKTIIIINLLDIFKFIIIGIWGFGFWILLLLIVLTFFAYKKSVPFSLTYWAYVFPLGIFALATLRLNKFLSYGIFKEIGILLSIVTIFLWLIIFILTIVNVFNKKLLYRK
ncbi:C4-dicarboxylate ABC transporter [Caldicellulosiruptoraceae bacterium PP1]